MSTTRLLIDNIAFAKRNEHLSGTLALEDCPRLAELLAPQALLAPGSSKMHADAIDYALHGEADALGRHFLHLVLNAALTVTCQRCLEPMPLRLSLSFDYLIGDADLDDSDAEEVDAVDEYDLQEASQAMDLLTLIEDEVIMALPIAPVHDRDCGTGAMQSGEKPNPFAVLKGLIKS